MELVRHLAASHAGTILAAAEFESIVHIWNLQTLAKLNTFETTLDFGGDRLAISCDGRIIAVGSWRSGVAVYSVLEGLELWRRKDLTRAQYLNFSPAGRWLWCCFDRRACHCFEASSGEAVVTIRDAVKTWENPFGSERLVQTRSKDFILNDQESSVARIAKASFAALSVAFSASAVCISEATGPVRLFDLSSGVQLWRNDPPKGVHFLEIAFSAASRRFMGVSWPFEKGGSRVLHYFDENGVTHPVCELPKNVYLTIFCMEGSRLITNEGAILETQSGRVEGHLPF